MMHERDMDGMMEAISEEETLEAQLHQAERAQGKDSPEARRLRGRLLDVIRREVEAEGDVNAGA